MSRAVIEACCAGESRRLRRLAVRFSGLLLMAPGQWLTTVIWATGPRGDRDGFAFEALDGKGQTVITHGLAEVDPLYPGKRDETS